MNLATLFVKISGDIGDLETKMTAAQRSVDRAAGGVSASWAAANGHIIRSTSAAGDAVKRIQLDILRAERAMKTGAIGARDYAAAIELARAEATQLGVAVGSKLDTAIFRAEQSISKTGVAVVKTGVGMASLRGAATALATSMLGTNAAVGSTVGILGSLAIGSGAMAGALIGLAALAAGYELITKDARDAKDAMQEVIDRADAMILKEDQGLLGQTGDDKLTAMAKVEQLTRERADLLAKIADPRRERATMLPGLEGPSQVINPNSDAALGEALRKQEALLGAWQRRYEALSNESAKIFAEDENAKTAAAQTESDRRIRIEEEYWRRVGQLQDQARGKMRKMAEASAAALQVGRGTGVVGKDGVVSFGRRGFPELDSENAIRQMRGRNADQGRGLNLNPVTMSTGAPTPFSIAGGGDLSFLSALKAQITGLAASFGPLAIAAAVLAPVMEGLAPVFEILKEPLRVLGQLIGLIITPALRLLEIPLKLAVTAVSYFTEALGYAQIAFGKLIDALPFISGGKIIQAGRDMVAGAQAARDALNGMSDAADKSTDTLTTNLPQGFRTISLQLAQFASATPVASRAPLGITGRGAVSVTDNRTTTIQIIESATGDGTFKRRVVEVIRSTFKEDGLLFEGDPSAFLPARS